MSATTRQNLDAVRAEMQKIGVDAVIIPGTDPHQSEYICDHWKTRDWVSGFTGSNGTAVITLTDAGLWTDSRYFLQATEQLQDSGFTLHKEDGPDRETKEQWLANQLQAGDIVAIDGQLFSAIQVNALEQFCFQNGLQLATDFDVADRCWHNRPQRPDAPAFVHDEKWAGETVDSKIERLMQQVKAQEAEAIFISSLDEIAWTLNLRGDDVLFTPVAIAYLYVSEKETTLFIDDCKVTDKVKKHLKDNHIKVRQYDEVKHFLDHLRESVSVLVDPSKVNDTLASAIAGRVYGTSPVAALKAVKNDTQLTGFRNAMERDGAALVRTFMWIEENVASGTLSELAVARRAIEERKKEDYYVEESFGMIAGYKEHGAIVHYEPDEQSDAVLSPEGLLLIDTGGQYLDGTTDITRTIALGTPTPAERHDYTLVLKGHLALGHAAFPEGTRGVQLDALARQFLWKENMTYYHGTGHGVGQFLGVHEGPHSVRTQENPVTLKEGMLTSNEPGLYKAGQYGIRIENMELVVKKAETADFGNFQQFETLTLFPYDLSLIDTTMLTAEEIDQVNQYHAIVRHRLTPLLNSAEQAWLNRKTELIK